MSEAVSVTATAQALGLTVGRSGSQHWISPCPSCGATRRHTKSADRRGPISVKPNDERWKCWQCDDGGTASWLAYRAGKPAPAVHAPQPLPALDYLDPAAARRFWHRCAHARARQGVAAWLDGLRLGQASCARALPFGWLPGWASGWAAHHHLVFALHDGDGRARNYLARAVLPGADKKSRAAAGVARGGLVLADQLGVDLLRGWYDGPCVIVEGEKKLLISEHLAAGRWATIGIGSGMWSAEVAASISRASRVLVYTDPGDGDGTGLIYATRVMRSIPTATLRPEFELRGERVEERSHGGVPDDDLWEAGGTPSYVDLALNTPGRGASSEAKI